VTSNNNAVYQNGFVIPEKLLAKLVGETVEEYLPPFIIPPIDVSEFFRAEGLKGIQGKRNSCYIDAVLSSMFAFTDTFDPYFLFKSNSFSKVPDSPLTKTGKKVLAEQIVNPLRQNYYCSASGVNELRELMIPFSNKLDGGFMGKFIQIWIHNKILVYICICLFLQILKNLCIYFFKISFNSKSLSSMKMELKTTCIKSI
jgi:hypothetical protein